MRFGRLQMPEREAGMRCRTGIVSRPLFCAEWEGGEAGEGEKGMQEKGNVSSPLLCDCLHIVFSRDMVGRLRDTGERNGGNPPFSYSICETHRLGCAR